MPKNSSPAHAIEASPAFSSALDQLFVRAPRLGNVVHATSRRRDVRETRARILLLLLEGGRYCPPNGFKRRPWYVLGAVARCGAEWLASAWRGFFGDDAPTVRSLLTHLGVLEKAAALVRSPGDWQPVWRDPEHPERRPRYPNTFHVLEDDDSAEWWAREGFFLLERFPETRSNPDAWRRIFGRWRELAARAVREPLLPFDGLLPEDAPRRVERVEPRRELHRRVIGRRDPSSADVARARAIASAARVMARKPLELLWRLRELRVDIRGAALQLRFQREPVRFAGAVMLLARALGRGDDIKNCAGWTVRAFNFAHELRTQGRNTWPRTRPETAI